MVSLVAVEPGLQRIVVGQHHEIQSRALTGPDDISDRTAPVGVGGMYVDCAHVARTGTGPGGRYGHSGRRGPGVRGRGGAGRFGADDQETIHDPEQDTGRGEDFQCIARSQHGMPPRLFPTVQPKREHRRR